MRQGSSRWRRVFTSCLDAIERAQMTEVNAIIVRWSAARWCSFVRSRARLRRRGCERNLSRRHMMRFRRLKGYGKGQCGDTYEQRERKSLVCCETWQLAAQG